MLVVDAPDLSRKEHLRAVRARLAELLANGTLPAPARDDLYPRTGDVSLHGSTRRHLADRLEAWTDEQKRAAQFVAGELERLDDWLRIF